MSKPTPTRVIALNIKGRLLSKSAAMIETTPLTAGDFGALDSTHFDMTLADGRVYRVRVSDITPERETA